MKLKSLTHVALLTAITAAFSQISIPIPFSPVPLTLSFVAVFLCGGLLSPKEAFLSQIVYLLLGAAGAPVFSAFRGGMAHLAGPTGGYLIVYPFMALLISFCISKWGCKTPVLYGSMAIATLLCYTIACAWLAVSMGIPLPAAVAQGAVPFIALDCAKIVLTSALVKPVARLITINT